MNVLPITFEHQGVDIVNPFVSSCGRFPADPVKDYGFEEWEYDASYHACSGLRKMLPGGKYILLTDSDGVSPPPSADNCVIGLYDIENDDDAIEVHELKEQLESDDADTLSNLTAFWQSYCKKEGLVCASADEMSSVNPNMTEDQKAVTEAFLKLWIIVTA